MFVKYTYESSQNKYYEDGDVYMEEAPSHNVVVNTDGYLLYMYITGLILSYDYGDHKEGIRKRFTRKPEFEFTGKWRITNNDSDKKETKMYVEIKHDYIKHVERSYISVEANTGWRRLFKKLKEVTVWEKKVDEACVSTLWVSEDKFEFRSLFQNECASCTE